MWTTENRPRYNRDERRDEPAGGRIERPEQGRYEAPSPPPAETPPPSGGVVPERGSPVLRADDGEVNNAPAFLQVRPTEPREDLPSEPRRPRRRRPARPFDGGAAASAEGEVEES